MRIIRKKNLILYPQLSYKICGLCFQTHNELGSYRNEKQYADRLEELLKKNNLNVEREKTLSPSFPGEKSKRNVVDFIIEDKVILEIKAKRIITKEDYYQVKRYLVSANKKLAILINFRRPFLQPKRIINNS